MPLGLLTPRLLPPFVFPQVQLQQAAEDHHPNVAHTQLLVQQARDLLQAAGLLVDEDSLHWNAASSLLELISSSSGGGSGSGSGSSSGSRHQPSPSLLLLFLMTVGRLRVDLDLDLVRLEPVPFGKPRLTVGAMRTDVAGAWWGLLVGCSLLSMH